MKEAGECSHDTTGKLTRKNHHALNEIRTHDLCVTGTLLDPPGGEGVLPQILDRGVPRWFLNPNPI